VDDLQIIVNGIGMAVDGSFKENHTQHFLKLIFYIYPFLMISYHII